jgi:hypothetical protein
MQSKVLRFGLMVAILSVSALHVFGGHPGPPKRHPEDHRQANMVMLRFQGALAEERWQDALVFCSDRVRAKAAEWSSPGAFFHETMPVEGFLAKDFGCSTCSSKYFGSFVDLPEQYGEPRVPTKRRTSMIQWLYAIYATNNTWVVDYTPVKLVDYIADKKAARQAREDRIKHIRKTLEPKLRGVKVHLSPLSEKFVIGSPMLFRLELINFGPTPIHYLNSGVQYHPLKVLNEKREVVPAYEQPSQIGVRQGDLASGASGILADKIDITQNHEISKAGKYFVQFDGRDLDIGEPFDDSVFGLLPTPTKFPSEIIEIEVLDRQKQ